MIEYEGRLYRRHPRHANKNKYSTLNKITSIRVHPSMDGATKKNLDFKTLIQRPKKIILIKRRGNSMKHNLLEMIQVTVWLHTNEFIFVWFYQTKPGAKTELLQCATTLYPG